MNISDLNKINIGEIKTYFTPQRLKDLFLRRPELLINSFVISVTILVTIFSFNIKKNQSQKLKTQIKNAQEKSEAIKKDQTTTEKLDTYFKQIPENLSPTQLIDLISDVAVKHNIKISTISPTRITTKELYDVTNVDFTVTANGFEDLAYFIYEIENIRKGLRVDKFSGSLIGRFPGSYGQQAGDNYYIQSDFTLGTIQFKK